MNIKVFDKKEIEETVFLKLINVPEGVEVVIVDQRGEEILDGYLLLITSEGITRYGFISNDYGFQLTEDGVLKDITDEED